jgi:hypothetical protein
VCVSVCVCVYVSVWVCVYLCVCVCVCVRVSERARNVSESPDAVYLAVRPDPPPNARNVPSHVQVQLAVPTCNGFAKAT